MKIKNKACRVQGHIETNLGRIAAKIDQLHESGNEKGKPKGPFSLTDMLRAEITAPTPGDLLSVFQEINKYDLTTVVKVHNQLSTKNPFKKVIVNFIYAH